MLRLLLALSSLAPLIAAEATIDATEVYQEIHGFGASSAWFADDLMRHPERERLLDLLFSRERGAGLSILRHRVQAQESQYTDHGMNLDSTDLDLGSKPWIGLRFADLDLGPDATIATAQLQLVAKAEHDEPCRLLMAGQTTDDAAPFRATPADISDREATAAAVEWAVPAWRGEERGAAQRSPDLAPILHEVVARPGWRAGNALVLVLRAAEGKRKAHSWDKDPALAPELVIELADGRRITARITASADDAEQMGRSDAAHAADLSAAAFTRGCEIVWAAAWSPPYAWKTSGTENNGFLKREHYQDYADHLEAFRARHDHLSGVALYGISPQNEPGKKKWESCEWRAEDYRDFVRDFLRPTLDPGCRILAVEETRWGAVPRFYQPIHDDPEAREAVDILAGHCYPKSDLDQDHTHFGKPVWMTEWSYDTSTEDLSVANGVTWAHHFHRLLVNANCSAVHHWWLVNFKDGRQQGLIGVDRDSGEIRIAKRLWTIGNFSRFVRPGWVRIAATSEPDPQVALSAFRDPATGDLAIVAINRAGDAGRELRLRFAGIACDRLTPYRTSDDEDLVELAPLAADAPLHLPPRSVTTFVARGAAE